MPGLAPGTGSITPKTGWLQYAENSLAPLRRKLGGSYMPKDDTQECIIEFGDESKARRIVASILSKFHSDYRYLERRIRGEEIVVAGADTGAAS